ncbi:MAG: trypsin-like peptidase domain-containing protein [Bacillota bacterium]
MEGYNGNYRPPQRNQISYFVIALVGAVIGALLIVALIPQLVPYMQSVDVIPTVAESPDPPTSDRSEESPTAASAPEIVTSEFEEVVKSVVRDSGPAVVSVINVREYRDVWGRTFSRPGEGSGVIIDESGYIITNYHVIEDAREIRVETGDGREMDAAIVGEDPATDLAVLKVEAEDLEALEFADSDTIDVGQLAVAIGNPLGREFARSVTVGVVSGVRATMYGQAAQQRVFQLLQTDASINAGNSGGALLDSNARIIGINTLKFSSADVEGMGFAIPANTVSRIADQLIENGRVIRAWMGVTVAEVSEAGDRYEDLPDSGVFIRQISPGSPAAAAGLQEGDVVRRMDDREIEQVVDMLTYLEEHCRPSQEVEVEVIRDGEEVVTDVKLVEMPQ